MQSWLCKSIFSSTLIFLWDIFKYVFCLLLLFIMNIIFYNPLMGYTINAIDENMKLNIISNKSMEKRRFLFGLHDKYIYTFFYLETENEYHNWN